jgi:hypothetical protein
VTIGWPVGAFIASFILSILLPSCCRSILRNSIGFFGPMVSHFLDKQ